MTFPFPIFCPKTSVANILLTDHAVDATNSASYTFSGRSLGAEAADRKILIAIAGDGNTATVSSVTVGGNAASLVTGAAVSDTDTRAEIWQIELPTGTTGDIVVNWDSGGMARMGIGVFRATGAQASAHDTGTSASNPASDTLNIPANGFALAVLALNSGTARTTTWTNLTEDATHGYDEVMEGNETHSGACADFATAQTGLAITATPSGVTNREAFAAASFGPA